MSRRRSVEVELPDASLEALSTYREKMLELIGVELSEGQVAAMLIHFGKQMAIDRPRGGTAAFALPAVTELTDEPTPVRRAKGSRAKAIERRARAMKGAPRASSSETTTCACGCGEVPRTPGAKWMLGHHKRGARTAARRSSTRRDKESDPEAEVVWDGRGPLSRPWERHETTEDIY